MSVRLATAWQLTRDTFRQANASGIAWMMFAVTGLCVLLCLSVSVSGDVELHGHDEPPLFLPAASPRTVVPSIALVLAGAGPFETAALTAAGAGVWHSFEVNPAEARREGVDTIGGQVSLAFGAVSFPVGRERDDAVRFIELLLAGGVAGMLGLLLALVWTAGFMPTYLEPSAASVLLAKPDPRWLLLLGKYLGVVVFVAFHVTLFVILTWLALGVRTGVWDATYWHCIPLLLMQFAIFYSFSVLLAVLTRSTVACVFGAVLFWLLAWGINYGNVMAHAVPEGQSLPGFTLLLTDAAYWISPKPIDAGLILFNSLDAQQHFDKPEVFRLLEAGRVFSPWWSILSSLLITVALLALSAYEFEATDY
ncbi:MAG: ABC transporter permease subunit [Gemmataceae bacterium]|nr:ABC transporter permease subunit [Gemmataceae bacterium]